TDPAHWARQLVEPVAFADALDALTATDERLVLVEVGLGRALTTLARQHPSFVDGRHRALPTLAQRHTDELADFRSALASVAGVWAEGHDVDWAAVEQAPRQRVPVPGYPYQRSPLWIDTPAGPAVAPEDDSPLRVVTWRERVRGPVPPVAGGAAVALLPADRSRAAEVSACLAAAGWRVVPVVVGESFADGTDSFTVRGAEPWDLSRVFRSLKKQGVAVGLVVHAGTVGAAADDVAGQLAGYLGGAELVRQAFRASTPDTRPGLLVLTEGAVDVSGQDPVLPGHAALAALAGTDCVGWAKLVDLGSGVPAADLVEEIGDRGGDSVVALRGHRRWVPARTALPVRDGPDPLREAGVHVVTGGAGPLGAAVATALAGTGLRPVLLLVDEQPPDPALVAELTAHGATVETGTPDQLAALVDDVTGRHGAVNGVFHLATVPGSGPLPATSTAKSLAALHGTVDGVLSLVGVFADRQAPDVFVTVTGRTGTEDDVAADSAVAALADRMPAGRRVVLEWPLWTDVARVGAVLPDVLRARTPQRVAIRPEGTGPIAAVAAPAQEPVATTTPVDGPANTTADV
ncbi:MAG TPA: KR domain-containing protein, partial [Pseudonocardiaceae bacterium]|nr:KR domain-containing protein [Pseudonocardiaceae bacterium]